MKTILTVFLSIFFVWIAQNWFEGKNDFPNTTGVVNTLDTLPPMPSDYEVNPLGRHKKKGYSYTKIEFRERISGKLVNLFDVVKNQPFSFDLYKYRDESSTDNPTYYIPSILAAKESSKLRSKIIYDKEHKAVQPEVDRVHLESWIILPQRNRTNYTLIFYRLASFGKVLEQNNISHHKPSISTFLGGRTTILVLNEKGEIVNTIKDIPEYVLSAGTAVTQDGKYLGIATGIGESEDAMYTVPEKWHIIDLEKEKIIIEQEKAGLFVSSIIDVNPPFIVETGDKLVLSTQGCPETQPNYSSAEYRVFDFNKMKIYSRCYQKNEPSGYSPYVWTHDGVLEKDFYTGSPDRKLFYTSDFEQHPLLLR